MKDIMKALHVFVMWLQEGVYDFSSFPLVVKDDLDEKHLEALKKIHDQAKAEGLEMILLYNYLVIITFHAGELHQLLEKIQIVTHSLSMCEKDVREIANPESANKVNCTKITL